MSRNPPRGDFHRDSAVHGRVDVRSPATPSSPDPLRDVTTYDARRAEVAAMIDEADRQDNHPMGPDGLADALMEIADGWYREALILQSSALPSAPDHRPESGPCEECGYHAGVEPENDRAHESWLARHQRHSVPDHRLREALDTLMATPAPHCGECSQRTDVDDERYWTRLAAVLQLVDVRAVLSEATPSSEPALDVERLSASVIEALNAVDDEWTADELTDLIAAEYRRLSASQPPESDIQ